MGRSISFEWDAKVLFSSRAADYDYIVFLFLLFSSCDLNFDLADSTAYLVSDLERRSSPTRWTPDPR